MIGIFTGYSNFLGNEENFSDWISKYRKKKWCIEVGNIILTGKISWQSIVFPLLLLYNTGGINCVADEGR